MKIKLKFIFLLSFILVLQNCSIKEIADITTNENKSQPISWDYNVETPAINKNYMMNNFITPPTISGSLTPNPLSTDWPLAASKTIAIGGSINIDILDVDFDGKNGVDMNINYIRSTDSLIKLTFNLKDNLNNYLSIYETQFASVDLDLSVGGVSVVYHLNNAQKINNSVILTTNFMQELPDYCLPNNSVISVNTLTVNLTQNPNTPAYTIFANDSKLNVVLDFEINTSNIEVIATIINDAELLNYDIPISDLTTNVEINSLRLDTTTYGLFPFTLQFTLDSQTMSIVPGILTHTTLPYDYWYVSSETQSENTINLSNLTNNINTKLLILASSGKKLKIPLNSSYIRLNADLYISGKIFL